jgi:hypothetical protein
MLLEQLRREYHQEICERLLSVDAHGIPSNADKHSDISVAMAKGIVDAIGLRTIGRKKAAGQISGKQFETLTATYLERAFTYIQHLRPGKWFFTIGKRIEDFEQYEHLALLTEILQEKRELRAALGDYLIKPDIIIGRYPVPDEEINQNEPLLSSTEKIAHLTPLRQNNSTKPILHASISCKWTIRSDRSQNARTEGLNLIRNRKGNTPHIVIVTAEPYPQRIASLALGTGDIDCVYHFALHELQAAAQQQKNSAVTDMLEMLVFGKRLRDIGDLPFDLAV